MGGWEGDVGGVGRSSLGGSGASGHGDGECTIEIGVTASGCGESL